MEKEYTEEWYEQKPSWWKKNWKWLVPSMGCLSIIIIAIFVFSYFGYKLVSTFNKEIPITEIVHKAENNSEVIQYTGKPLNVKQIYNRSMNYNNGVSQIETNFSVSGPKGSGEINAKATEVNNQWKFEVLQFRPDGEEKIISIK